MALSRLAQEFAAEISNHDWSDAPYRADRAGHRLEDDANASTQVLDIGETDTVRMNVMWVVAQVLLHADPNMDPHEFGDACGVDTRDSRGGKSGWITSGLRMRDGRYCRPGTWDTDED